MSGPRERELKYVFARREDWLRLVDDASLGEPLPTVLQTNHYFDTADLTLVRTGVMLRLREQHEEGATPRVVATWKSGRDATAQPGYFDAVEIEATVEPELLDTAIASPSALVRHDCAPARELRDRCGELPLELIGWLRTKRLRRRCPRFVVELDEIEFPDETRSWELEIETDDPDDARAFVQATLERLGAQAEPQRQTKLEVLLDRCASRGSRRNAPRP